MLRFDILIAAAVLPTMAHVASTGGLSSLTATERSRIFAAAGFAQEGGVWKGCEGMSEVILDDDWIDGGAVRDLNGDGKVEAIVGDQGIACYGATGQGYAILQSTAAGWKVLEHGDGIPHVLDTKGKDGWRDIEVGGPGFCFPILRWNGREYAVNRHEYEGKPCSPGR